MSSNHNRSVLIIPIPYLQMCSLTKTCDPETYTPTRSQARAGKLELPRLCVPRGAAFLFPLIL